MTTTTIPNADSNAPAQSPDFRKSAPARRFYAMDWLRCGAFLLLIWVHTATMFAAGGWHLAFPEIRGLETLVAVCKPWRMGLIFLVSGTALSYSLDRRGADGFAAQISKRLLPPLLVGVLVLVPPVFFFESMANGTPMGLADAYMLQAQRIAQGDLTWYIFWYLGYLLAFCLGLAAIWHWLSRPVHALRGIELRGERSALMAVLLFGSPLIAVEVLLSPYFPPRRDFVSDVASVASFGILFFYGMTVMRNEQVISALRRYWMLLFFLAAGVTYAAMGMADPKSVVSDALRGAQIWLTICFLAAAAIRFLDRPARSVAGFNRIVFPFYMLHQLAILTAAWLLANQIGGLLLYGVTGVAASILSVVVIRAFILPLPSLHRWFGIHAAIEVQSGSATRDPLHCPSCESADQAAEG